MWLPGMYSDSADNADTDQPIREYNQQQYIARTRQSRQYHYNKQQQQQQRGFIQTQKTSMPSSRTIKSKQSFDVPPSSSRNISGGISSNHTPQHSGNNDFITPRNRATQHNNNSSHMSSSEPRLPHHHHHHVVAPHTDPTGGVVVSSRSGNRRRTSMLRTRNESNLVVDSTTMSSSSSHGLSSSYRRKSKTTGHNSHHNSSNSSLTETPHRYNSHRNSNSSRNKKKVKESPMIGFYSNSKSYLPRNTSFSFTTPYPFVLASSSESNNSCDPYPYSNSPNYEGYNHSHHHSYSGERGMMTMDSASSNSNTFSPSSSSTTTPRSLFRDMSDSAHSSSSNRYSMMNRMFVWKTRNLYRVLLPFLLVSGVVCTFMVSSDLYLHTQVSLTRKNRSSSVSAAGARVLYLNNELHNHKNKKKKTKGAFPVLKQRTVQEYPTEFSDNTQLYGILDSLDPALVLMEIREPYTDEKKALEPLAKWQTQFHPSCNDMHTLDFAEPEQFAELFGTKGYWRHAWHVANEFSLETEDHVVVKTLKYEHNFEDAHFEHDRIDAVAMERLTSSPHVINIYGFCGHSVVTEYADGKRLGSLADKQKHHPEILLQIALDIANGMNDIHTISIEDGDEERGFNSKGDMNTFVHLDVNPANVVSVGGTLKFNDFNIGIMRKWNRTSSSLAGFPAQYPNPQVS